MDTILQVAGAVMVANILTAVLLYGCWQASKVYRDEDARPGMLACIVFPLAFLALVIWVYL